MNVTEAEHVADLERQVQRLEHALRREREATRQWKRKAAATNDLLDALDRVAELLEDES